MNNEVVVYQQLKHLGIPANLKGYRYLQVGIQLVLEEPELIDHMTKAFYPKVARICNTTTPRAERAIRHAIEYVYENTDPEVPAEYFGNTMNASSGKLTNSQFIAGVVEYIKMEVNHD